MDIDELGCTVGPGSIAQVTRTTGDHFAIGQGAFQLVIRTNAHISPRIIVESNRQIQVCGHSAFWLTPMEKQTDQLACRNGDTRPARQRYGRRTRGSFIKWHNDISQLLVDQAVLERSLACKSAK